MWTDGVGEMGLKGECWGLVLGIWGEGKEDLCLCFFFRVGERFWSAHLLQNGSWYYGKVG